MFNAVFFRSSVLAQGGCVQQLCVAVGRGWFAAGVRGRCSSFSHRQAAAQHYLQATAQAGRTRPPERGLMAALGFAATRGAPRLKLSVGRSVEKVIQSE